MKRVVLVTVMLAAACRPNATTELSAAHASAMEDSVATFLSAWSSAGQAGDWDRLLERYADDPDFVWVEDGQVRYRSVQEVRAGLASLGESFAGVSTDFIDPTIYPLAPGLANVVTRFRTTLHASDGNDIQFGGAMTMTVRNTQDGWKALQGHTSSARQR